MRRLRLKRHAIIAIEENRHSTTVRNAIRKPDGITVGELRVAITKTRTREGLTWSLWKLIARSSITLLRLFRKIPTHSVMKIVIILHEEGKIIITSDDGILQESDVTRFANTSRNRRNLRTLFNMFEFGKHRLRLTDDGKHSYAFSIGLKHGFDSSEYFQAAEKVALAKRKASFD